MKFVRAIVPTSNSDEVKNAIEKTSPVHWSANKEYGSDEIALDIIVEDQQGQELVQKLEDLLSGVEGWRITVLPADATLPRPENDDDNSEATKPIRAMLEPLYQRAEDGCELNTDFLVLTALSSIVAAIGMNGDSVTVVIAAMVIAPLLGPILAFSVGNTLGDKKLMLRALKAGFWGFLLAFVIAAAISLTMNTNLESAELIERTEVHPAVIVLALAGGAAAALSLASGQASALVGVMVAVALLPPLVAAGIYAGAAEFKNALKSLLLMGLNVVCVMLAAQLIFFWKGVRARKWHEKRVALRSAKFNIALWVLLAAILSYLIARTGSG